MSAPANSTHASTKWSSGEIHKFLRKAKRVYTSEALDIRIAPRSQTTGRILIITPKKMGNAPQRNRFRRRMKAIFYEQNLAAQALDIAIFSKAPANLLSFAELQAILLALYKPEAAKPATPA